jgi:hypothetical protein
MPATEIFVGAVVRRGDGILLVRQAPGHPLAGHWTVPWGQLEPGESPLDTETDAARYVTLAALDAMSEPMEPWSDWLVRRVFAGSVTVTPCDLTNPLQVHGAFL